MCRSGGWHVPEMSLGHKGCSTATDLQPPLLAEGRLRRMCNSLCFLSGDEATRLLLRCSQGRGGHIQPQPGIPFIPLQTPSELLWDQQREGGGCRKEGCGQQPCGPWPCGRGVQGIINLLARSGQRLEIPMWKVVLWQQHKNKPLTVVSGRDIGCVHLSVQQ